MRRSACILTALVLSACSASQTGTTAEDTVDTATDYKLTKVAEGFAFPWGAVFLPDGDLLVTERDGNLKVISDNWSSISAPVLNVPEAYVAGQGGLMDVALDPDFESNRQIYISYAEGTRAANRTTVARARLSEDKSALENVEVIFAANFDKRGGYHYGGRLAFWNDGTLFITLGEGSRYKEESQNLTNHLGTVVRINTDGSAPSDNPFIDSEDTPPEIWSYGHRNVQGLAFDEENQIIYTNEHGPMGGDEINVTLPGRNYGWPAITYGVNYDGTIISDKTHLEGMEQPIVKWVPSIAPSGMIFYSGDKFPELKGDLLVSALAGSHLRHIDLETGQVTGQQILVDAEMRLRFVIEGPDGDIFVGEDSPEGGLYRLDRVSENAG